MKTSIPRLRRIRYKDGRTIEVLRPGATDPVYMARKASEFITNQMVGVSGPVGMAIVLWDSAGLTSGKVYNGSPIPGILVPDLVRNVLLGLKVEQWTIDTINGN